MRTTLCTLVFLFSLPWSLNGHLTTSNKNFAVTNTAENASRQRDYTTDSGTENVVSLSRSIQTRQLTSHSEQQEIRLRTANGEDETSRTRRNVHYDKHNLTTMSTHPETQMQDKVTQKRNYKNQQKVPADRILHLFCRQRMLQNWMSLLTIRCHKGRCFARGKDKQWTFWDTESHSGNTFYFRFHWALWCASK